jgi:hypothetical protein
MKLLGKKWIVGIQVQFIQSIGLDIFDSFKTVLFGAQLLPISFFKEVYQIVPVVLHASDRPYILRLKSIQKAIEGAEASAIRADRDRDSGLKDHLAWRNFTCIDQAANKT